MNNLIEEDFTPKMAIIAYSQGGEYNEHYLESRKIKKNSGGYEMLEGTPLTKKLLAELLEKIDPIALEKTYCKGLLPQNLLAFNNENAEPTVIWYLKASERHLSFTKGLAKDGLMKLPALVFMLKGTTLSVWAIKTNNPNEDTVLYSAPFHNIYGDGKVCMGSAKTYKFKEVHSIMKNWEDAFFQSKFTHLNRESPIVGNLTTFINRQIKGKLPFDKNVLVATNKTIGDLI